MAAKLSEPRQREYRCSYCGAPLDVGPDSVVVVCRYCGRPNWVRGRRGTVYTVKGVSVDEAAQRFMEFVKRDPDLRKLRIAPARIEIVYLPYYHASGRVSSSYEASGTLTVRIARRRQRGETEYETRMVPFHVKGVYRAEYRGLFVGKRSPGEDGVDELAEYMLRAEPGLEPLEKLEVGESVAVLGADYTAEEVKGSVEDEVCDRVRAEVEEEIRRRARAQYRGPGTVVSVNIGRRSMTCDIESMDVRGPIYAPMVKVFYVYDGKIYRAYFAGWDMYPLIREEPFTPGQRLFFTGLGGAVGGGIAAAAAPALSMFGGVEGLLAAGLLVAAGAVSGYMVSKAGLAEARVERGRAKRWISSVLTTVERKAG